MSMRRQSAAAIAFAAAALATVPLGGCSRRSRQTAKQLVGPTFVGKIDSAPVTLQVTEKADGKLSGLLTYTYFGKPGGRETMDVRIDGDAVELTGRHWEQVAGPGDDHRDHLHAKMSPDGTTVAGTNKREYEWPTLFSLSTSQTLAAIDPPLDMTAVTTALLEGRWEGKVGPRPARLRFTRDGEDLLATVEHGERVTHASVVLRDTGTLELEAQERPTADGLLKEGFDFLLQRGLGAMNGGHHVSVTQGFATSSTYEDASFRRLPPAAADHP